MELFLGEGGKEPGIVFALHLAWVPLMTALGISPPHVVLLQVGCPMSNYLGSFVLYLMRSLLLCCLVFVAELSWHADLCKGAVCRITPCEGLGHCNSWSRLWVEELRQNQAGPARGGGALALIEEHTDCAVQGKGWR